MLALQKLPLFQFIQWGEKNLLKILYPTVMQFDVFFGFKCSLKYLVIIIKHCSSIPKWRKLWNSFPSSQIHWQANPLSSGRGGLWFSQFDDDHFSLTTSRSCFLEADPYGSWWHFQTSRNDAFGKQNQLLAFWKSYSEVGSS